MDGLCSLILQAASKIEKSTPRTRPQLIPEPLTLSKSLSDGKSNSIRGHTQTPSLGAPLVSAPDKTLSESQPLLVQSKSETKPQPTVKPECEVNQQPQPKPEAQIHPGDKKRNKENRFGLKLKIPMTEGEESKDAQGPGIQSESDAIRGRNKKRKADTAVQPP
eukprot:1318996-Amorphochlora_amoeboformis.AAC.1